MSEVIKQSAIPANVIAKQVPESSWRSYLLAIFPIAGAILVALARLELGKAHFPTDGALILLALACYVTAAAFLLTDIYAPSRFLQRAGLWIASLGAFFNLSSWGVRWIAAREREMEIILRNGGEMPWVWRYIPFANLYDLSIAFAFGAALTALLLAHRSSGRIIAALSLPLTSLILTLAIFIGNDFINLPPVLDSYWRPIHVGFASLSYGVALVCFAIAVLYLLKDGVKTEAMAIWTSIFALAVFGSISRFGVFFTGKYTASTIFTTAEGTHISLPLRADIAYVGPLLIVSALLLLGVIATFGKYLASDDARARLWGHRLLKLSFVTQAVAVVALMAQLKTTGDVLARIDASQYAQFGEWVLKQSGATVEQTAAMSQAQLQQVAAQWIAMNGQALQLSLKSNPVELAALITALAGTFFVILFSFRTERLRAALPSLERLDSLMYKTAGMTFALLAVLLVTGAIWANESWGRYWGWDPKETGAFVAWLTYAAYLHSRIARGWTGRRSAYFAIIGFLLIVFTYLGVSYLLPGLHSYA
jgi:cytochrome c-type biogenesis protein CcsB